jgi:hypothetical protein
MKIYKHLYCFICAIASQNCGIATFLAQVPPGPLRPFHWRSLGVSALNKPFSPPKAAEGAADSSKEGDPGRQTRGQDPGLGAVTNGWLVRQSIPIFSQRSSARSSAPPRPIGSWVLRRLSSVRRPMRGTNWTRRRGGREALLRVRGSLRKSWLPRAPRVLLA